MNDDMAVQILRAINEFREENNKRWEQNEKRWEENDRRWEEMKNAGIDFIEN